MDNEAAVELAHVIFRVVDSLKVFFPEEGVATLGDRRNNILRKC